LIRYLNNVWNAIKNKKSTHISDFLSGGDLPETSNNALKYSAFFGCIRVLGETYASVSIDEFQRKPNGDKIKTDKTGLRDILKHEPNGYTTAYNFHEMSMNQNNTQGNFYAIKDKTNGQITGLRQLQSESVQPDIKNGKLIYKYNDIEWTRKDIYHVPGFSLDGLVGLSPLEYFASIVDVGMTYQKFSNKYYKNGIFSTGVFEKEGPGKMREDAFENLQKQIKKLWSGEKNFGRPIIVEDNTKFKQLTIKPIDAQLLESKKFSIEDMARVFRVPLHLLQNLDKATFNNIEELGIGFVVYTMLPHFKRNEAAINSQLLTKQQRKKGYFFEFNIQSLLRGNIQAMAESFMTGRMGGWLSVNDIRRLLNMNSIGPDGDVYLEPLNHVPAGTEREKVENKMTKQIKNLIEQAGE
jgi:HK97 family phage portal protein